MSKLYVVPTPIGNLEDITLRAIKILREVDFILAEDTRRSSILLNHYQISTPLISHHKYNEHRSLDKILDHLLSGRTIALISDAGTPAISDPGFLLVRECIDRGVKVETLPGATAFLPALVNSGFPSDRFVFEGFLPLKKGRESRLRELSQEERTVILYESPYRLTKTLEQISKFFGPQRLLSLSRELTKLHEEVCNGSVEEMLDYYGKGSIKGEIVIVIKGIDKRDKKDKNREKRDEERDKGREESIS